LRKSLLHYKKLKSRQSKGHVLQRQGKGEKPACRKEIRKKLKEADDRSRNEKTQNGRRPKEVTAGND